jgi:hypothetical protein
MRWRVSAVGCVVGLAVAAPAGANMAAMSRMPGAVDGPVLLRPTAVEVVGETLRLDCDAADGGIACTFEARYRISNPTEAVESLVGVFYGVRAEGVTIRLDGAAAEAALDEAVVEALDERLPDVSGGGWRPDREGEGTVSRFGFEAEVAAGAERDVVVSGTVRPGERFEPSGWVSPVVTRHLALGTVPREAEVFDLEYLLYPIDTWAAVGPIDVTVRFPADWEVTAGPAGSLDRYELPGEDGEWTRTEEGGAAVMSRRWAAGDSSRPTVLMVGLRRPDAGVRFHNGGVMLGFGGGATDGEGGFQMRFGYEVAAPDWLFYQLDVDTSFGDRLTITAVVEAASPMPYMPILPSLHAGLGLPVQILPDVRVGIRLQTGLMWGPVGFTASLDFYPSLDTGDGEFFQALLLGMISV